MFSFQGKFNIHSWALSRRCLADDERKFAPAEVKYFIEKHPIENEWAANDMPVKF